MPLPVLNSQQLCLFCLYLVLFCLLACTFPFGIPWALIHLCLICTETLSQHCSNPTSTIITTSYSCTHIYYSHCFPATIFVLLSFYSLHHPVPPMNTGSDAPAAQSSTMTTSMPAANVDVSDVTSLGRAAIAALAGRDPSPHHASHASPSHSRSHSHSYPQSHPHSRSQSQSEYYQSLQSLQSRMQHRQQNQNQNQPPPSSSPSRTSPLSRARHAAEDSINASGVFPPPPFASDRPTSTSHDHYQQQQQRQQQREQRSPSPSAARTAPKMAAARRPLPSAAPNNAAPVPSSSHSKPSSRRPSASSASPV